MKTVTTWSELEAEVRRLHEWYVNALECCEDIIHATANRNEELLRSALAKHKDLKALPPFRVSEDVYRSPRPPLHLVN